MLMPLATYFPNLAGGLLIGLSAGVLRVATGQVAGISSILRRAVAGPQRGWQLAFLAGLIIPGLAALGARHQDLASGLDNASPALLAGAGLLVGVGTGLANGCTSGHGICGLAGFSRRSLVAVLTFMSVGALTVLVTRHGGL